MQDHDIWEIPGWAGYQGHDSGHRRPRSQDVPELPRQAPRGNSPERPGGPPTGMGSPSGTYRSPLGTFAPRRGLGSPHASGMQGGTPEQRQETRNPGQSCRRSRTPPPAARRVVFHEDMDRDNGGPCDPHAQQTSSTTDPRRRSKRPAPNGRTSPPFSRQSSVSSRQRFTRTRAGRQTEHPARLPPPSQVQRPTRCRGDHTPRTRDKRSLRPTQGLRNERGNSPPRSPETAKPRRAHRSNGGTTRAAQGRTQK